MAKRSAKFLESSVLSFASAMLTFSGLLAAMPAVAADPKPFERVESGASATVKQEPLEQSPTLVVTEEQCRQVVRHTPAADVTYQPGTDVYGRPVAPAEPDPAANAIELPKEFDIAIGVDVQSRRGQAESPRPFEATLPVGNVTVKGDRFYFNGKEFGGEAALRLEQACREFLAQKPPRR